MNFIYNSKAIFLRFSADEMVSLDWAFTFGAVNLTVPKDVKTYCALTPRTLRDEWDFKK